MILLCCARRVGPDCQMIRFYSVSPIESDECGVLAVLSPPLGDSLGVRPEEIFARCERPTFELRSGPLCDYLASDLAWCLCSSRLRDVIDRATSPADVYEWRDVEVRTSEGPVNYSNLQIRNEGDVLDRARSILVDNDFVVKAVLSLEKLRGRRIVRLPGDFVRLYTSEEVK